MSWGLFQNSKKVLDGRLTLLDKKKKTAHSHNRSELWIHRMNWFSCIINTLNESSTLAGWKAPRKSLIMLDGQG